MNVYLKILDDAKKAPASYASMGIEPREFSNTGLYANRPLTVTGWRLCELTYKMNEDGREWWSNREEIVVGTSGELFQFHSSEEFDGVSQRKSHSSLTSVDAARLLMLYENGWNFAAIPAALAQLV